METLCYKISKMWFALSKFKIQNLKFKIQNLNLKLKTISKQFLTCHNWDTLHIKTKQERTGWEPKSNIKGGGGFLCIFHFGWTMFAKTCFRCKHWYLLKSNQVIRNWFFESNSKFIIPISLQPDFDILKFGYLIY